MTPPKNPQRLLCEEITSSFSTNHPCAQWFGSIERSVMELARQVENLATDVKELTKQVSGQEKMVDFLQDSLLPQFQDIPEKITESITEHRESCPANRRAMKRAEGLTTNSDTEMPRPEKESGKFTIPKFVLYIGAAIGTAVAVGGYLLTYLLGGSN